MTLDEEIDKLGTKFVQAGCEKLSMMRSSPAIPTIALERIVTL